MRSVLSWVALASFSAGLCVELAQRYRTVLGILGLLVSLFGAVHFLWPAQTSRFGKASEPQDLHERLVLDTCDRLDLMASATLVGVLHEYRIVPARNESRWYEALELRHAIAVVARVSGLDREQLGLVYRWHWVELRRTTAPRIIAAISSHPLVERLSRYPEVA